MLTNYLKLAWRKLHRNRLYSFIQVGGLAVGVAFCLLVFLFVRHEHSYDRFHAKAGQLYVIKTLMGGLPEEIMSQNEQKWYDFLETPGISWLTAPRPLKLHLPTEVPFVKRVSHIRFDDYAMMVVNANQRALKAKVGYADTEALQMLSFGLLHGSQATALDGPGKMVITTTLAQKLFGRADVVGQSLTLLLNDVTPFVISGVMAPLPANSSLQADLLINHQNSPFRKYDPTQWTTSHTTLIEVVAGTTPDQLAKGLTNFTAKHQAEVNQMFKGMMMAGPDGSPVDMGKLTANLTAIPLTMIHFHTGAQGSSRAVYSYLLAAMAGLVLFIACINYIVLAITGANARRAEVGLRKVAGASRWQLLSQFYLEAGLLVGTALLVGLALAQLALPWFNQLCGQELALGWPQLLGASGVLLGLGVLTSLLTGGYPAWILAAINPAQALKGWQTYRFRPGLVKVLVVVQYSSSAFLLATAWVMGQQMDYLLRHDLGYNQQQLLMLNVRGGVGGISDQPGRRIFNALKHELAGYPGVVKMTGLGLALDMPLAMFSRDTSQFYHPTYGVEDEFVTTLGLKILEGRALSRQNPADTLNAVLINEAMVKRLNLRPPVVGQTINVWHPTRMHGAQQVVGVVKNFHFASLEKAVEPLTIGLVPETSTNLGQVIIRLQPGQVGAVMAILQAKWPQIAPGLPFEYHFQDQKVMVQYASYQRWTRIFEAASGLALLIACLGLYALAGLLAANRTKEMGIRKVFGASAGQLLLLLNQAIVKLALLAFALALPLAWLALQSWLENFAYRMPLSGWGFAAVGLCLLASALLAVAHHAWRAATANPVRSLRHE
jgi:putative ABC transport system permease protein